MKMIISAGGTGGHIYPALAIISYFQEHDKDFEVLYIGTHNRMENTIVPSHNIPFKSIEIYGFSKNIGRDFKNVFCLFNSYQKCLKIIEEFKPDIVVGVGGYVTLPVLMAAKKKKCKCVIHEQNSIPGKTNKFLAKSVNRVFTSFKESNKYFEGANVIFTGNPSGDNVITMKPMNKESLGFHKNKKLVVVTSGSLGSSALNTKLIEFLHLSKNSDYEVLFITGKGNYDEFIKTNKFSPNIKVVPYLDNLASLFKSSDLVISRAGAGVISELIMASIPSILIPSPNVANNHQFYNALSLADNKLAIKIDEETIDAEKLYQLVEKLLQKNDKEYQTLKNNLEKYPKFSSSQKIYEEIKGVVNGTK